jgi:hypothetical protein
MASRDRLAVGLPKHFKAGTGRVTNPPQDTILPHLRAPYYASAKFKFSIASSISAVLL